ncbi:PIR protein CIR protein, fragment [Plasmodium vinckei brucechwatti]|uniref:PIR protein CIR protein n=1 Tax=Plasmodium vinckei brucechwatti TaxID=119398 RepID=A0A6V7SF82_PLAVN|nr:PIR protein CIR protein, fragment [Plasmodium vinckei brucechwatti]
MQIKTWLCKKFDIDNNKTTGKQSVQLIKSPNFNPNLKKPWNGPGNCKPEINFMNATLVCCIYEHCSLIGILDTLVLIPIILLIVYKNNQSSDIHGFIFKNTYKYVTIINK